MDFKHLVCVVLMLSVVLMMSWCCDATFGGGSHKKVIIHVPVKYHTHTHTIYRHIYHHHKAKEVEKPVFEEEKKVEEEVQHEKTHEASASHYEPEKKQIAEAKYDRPDFHVYAKKLVESMKDRREPWAMHFHVVERTY